MPDRRQGLIVCQGVTIIFKLFAIISCWDEAQPIPPGDSRFVVDNMIIHHGVRLISWFQGGTVFSP